MPSRGDMLPSFSAEEAKIFISKCTICLKIKPLFCKVKGRLIKATRSMERLNIDFKGPLPTETRNKYILTIVDENSRYPFAFACPDMESSTVMKCFDQLFAIFGYCSYVHNDRAPNLMSKELRKYLNDRGIATSRTSRYNPAGNGQVECFNGVIWQTVLWHWNRRIYPLNVWEF